MVADAEVPEADEGVSGAGTLGCATGAAASAALLVDAGIMVAGVVSPAGDVVPGCTAAG